MSKVQRDKFLKELPNSPNPTEAARRAGYKKPQQQAYRLMRDEQIAKKIDRLIDVGLDTLEDVASNGRNEIARATAAKTLVETGMGKPKDNKSTTFGDITINVAKIDPATLQALKA